MTTNTPSPGNRPGPSTYLTLTAAYTLVWAAATYPVCRNLATCLPSLADPIQHLWVMRWYRACLLEGRWPFFCPDIQYPVGAQFGSFSPLHLQSLLYCLISSVVDNDILTYNLIWALGYVGHGLGTFTLVWHLLRDRLCAAVAGLIAMLSGAAMIHGFGHVDIIYLGGIPLFYLAWIQFVDAPSRRSLLYAVSAYLLLALCDAYYVHLAIIPALLYASCSLFQSGRVNFKAWLGNRFLWFTGFAAMVLPCLLLIYLAQVLALSSPDSAQAVRSRLIEFKLFGAPFWSYFTPTHFHALGKLLPFRVHVAAGHDAGMVERSSYLGLVCLFLIHQAWFRRAELPARRFWWTALALMIVLGMGASTTIGSLQIPLPSAWLWKLLPNFQMMRVPGRFNLFVIPCAAALAAAGLKSLLATYPGSRTRLALGLGFALLAAVDLAMVPFGMSYRPPPLSPTYGRILEHDPSATFLDAPVASSGSAEPLTSLAGYWQSIHRGRTTAAYSGCPNFSFDNRVAYGSPLSVWNLADPSYPREVEQYDLVRNAPFDAYLWLYLRSNNLRYVALHRTVGRFPTAAATSDRLQARLAAACIAGEEDRLFFDRDLLPLPRQPVIYCLEGFKRRSFWAGFSGSVVEAEARLAAYCPPGAGTVQLTMTASPLAGPCHVRLLAHTGALLASWTVKGGKLDTKITTFQPPFAGYQEWTLVVEPLRPAPEPAWYISQSSPTARLFVDHFEISPLGLASPVDRPSHSDSATAGIPAHQGDPLAAARVSSPE